MKTKQLLFILFFTPSFLFAQYDKVYEQIAKTMLDGDYSKCAFIFNSVYKPEKKIETEKSMDVLMWGTFANFQMSLKNSSYKPKAKELLDKSFNIFEERERSLSSSNSSVRLFLLQNVTMFGKIFGIGYLHADAEDNVLSEYSDKFDHLFWEKRLSLDINDVKEASTYLEILRIKATMFHYQNNALQIHKIVLPEIYEIVRKSKHENVHKTASLYLNSINSMVNSILQVCLTESLNYRFEYCYNLDKLNEIIFKEPHYSEKYEKVGLDRLSDIQTHIKNDECIIYVYNLHIGPVIVYGWIGLSKTLYAPIQGVFTDDANEIRESILKTIPGKNKYIIIPLTSACDLDIAGSDIRFYMKFSITHHLNSKHVSHYQGKDVEYIGDFDFGKGNTIEKLSNEDKYYFTNNWNGKFLDNSSSKFSLQYLMFPPQRIEIIHISTHGIEEKNKSLLSSENFLYGDLNSVCLAMPKYNENPKANVIRGLEISKCRMSNISIVFLSLCESAKANGKNGPIQISGSLAKAFYGAGAHNIIGFTTKIEDNIATEFTKRFYEKLKNNPNSSIHDIFYNTKNEINRDYKQSIGILLWE